MIAHIVTTLALATSDDTHLVDARDLLTASIDQLSTSTTRTRALALTQARLAVLHQHTGDRDRADHWLAQARTHATDLRSARLNHHLSRG